MKLTLASNNRHKLDELQQLLPEFELHLPQDFGIDFNCAETANNYRENSLCKAFTLFRQLGTAVIADDSGLEVVALNGRPGVKSARYASSSTRTQPTSLEQMTELLRELQDVKNRQARFICGLSLLEDEHNFVYVQCSLEGEIATEMHGEQGFGYDPLFYLPKKNCCLAELSMQEKNLISHRAQAAKRLLALYTQVKLNPFVQ